MVPSSQAGFDRSQQFLPPLHLEMALVYTNDKPICSGIIYACRVHRQLCFLSLLQFDLGQG